MSKELSPVGRRLDPTAQQLVTIARAALSRGDASAVGVAANLMVRVYVATSDDGERTRIALRQACAAVGIEAAEDCRLLDCAEFLRDHLVQTWVKGGRA